MGELIVRASVWLAVACYPAGAYGAWRPAGACTNVARALWTLGCVAFLVHVGSAFHVNYDWSHDVALRETARQTEALTGVRSGQGLWLNYVFAAVWLVDVARWWMDPQAYAARSFGLRLALHGFFLFMIVNGAVVFATGSVRILGLVVTVVGIVIFVKRSAPGGPP